MSRLGDDETPYDLRDRKDSAFVESDKLPPVGRWTAEGYRACDAAERTESGDDVIRCPKRAVFQAVYLVLKPKEATRESGFCKDHEDAGVAALLAGAERGEVLPAMKVRVSPRGFRRGV